MNPDTILLYVQLGLAGVQVLSLIALVVYVVKTWEMAGATRRAAEASEQTLAEMRASRDEESAPYVVATFDLLHHGFMELVVKNIGKTVASDVRVEFVPPLTVSQPEWIEKVTFLRDGIKSLPPGGELRALVDTSPAYLNHEPPLPSHYQVTVRYTGGISKAERVLLHDLDIAGHRGLLLDNRATLDDVVKQLKEIAKHTHHLGRPEPKLNAAQQPVVPALGTVFHAHYGLSDGANRQAIQSKLREFRILWTVLYAPERADSTELDQLQLEAKLIARELTVLISDDCDAISETERDSLVQVVRRMHILGTTHLYADGGTSWNNFVTLGDQLAADLEGLLQDFSQATLRS